MRITFDAKRCVGCKSCEVACAVAHSTSGDLEEAVNESPSPLPRLSVFLKKGKIHLARCVHCEKPKCVEACETGAITKGEEGVVHIDEEKCVGCWACVEACPFDAIVKNEELGVAQKCDLCSGRETPACVEACQTEALTMV